MTINEIQSTLDQLKQRHPGLDENLVTTLLQAGGWDEISIKEALMLFKTGHLNESLPHEDSVSLPEPPEILLEEKYIPHDLPLKPFENPSDDSRVIKDRDGFHENAMSAVKAKEEGTPIATNEKIVQGSDEIKSSNHLSLKDDGIIALSFLLAIIVALLLVYMYMSGRL